VQHKNILNCVILRNCYTRILQGKQVDPFQTVFQSFLCNKANTKQVYFGYQAGLMRILLKMMEQRRAIAEKWGMIYKA